MSLIKKIVQKISPGIHEEMNVVESWKNEYNEQIKALSNLHTEPLDEQKVKAFKDFNPDKAWTAFEAKVDVGSENTDQKFRVTPLVRWAAVFVFVIVAGIVWQNYLRISPQGIVHQAKEEALNVYLPDKSNVTLDVGAVLTENNFRKVSVTGRAFFEVAKNPEDTFEIKTTHGKVQVLGTSFFVSALDTKSEVHVLEGKVALDNGKVKIFLTAGQKAVMNKDTMYKVDLTGSIIADWRSNVLHFNNASLSDVLKTVADYFQIELVMPENIKSDDCTIKTRFVDAKLEDVLKEISLITKMKYTLNQNKLIVTKMGC
jgi:ferric-dicitrate binding protein FerR (iron transport regulator)